MRISPILGRYLGFVAEDAHGMRLSLEPVDIGFKAAVDESRKACQGTEHPESISSASAETYRTHIQNSRRQPENT